MAKVTIVGEAMVLTSSMKLKELETIKKYRPSALILMGGKEGKEPVFCVGVVPGCSGSVNSCSVNFGQETRDDQKLATMTLMLNAPDGNIKEYIADKFGELIMNLNALEAILPDVLVEINAQKKAIMDNISIAQ